MDRKSVSFLLLGLVIGVLLAATIFVGAIRRERLAGGGAAGADGAPRLVLKFAHNLDQNHPVHTGIVHFAERVAALSEGRLQVQVFPNGQLGSEPDTVEQLQRGALALVKTSTGSLEAFVPEMATFSLPYLFRDSTHYWQVLDGPVGKELLDAPVAFGIRGLGYLDAGARSFYTGSRPILAPADLRGLKIRVQPSRIARDLIVALDAGPTPIPWGELYTALQQKMVDGAENNPPSFVSSRHYEVARHFSLNEHTRVPDVIIFSERIWATLNPRQHGWLQQAAAEASLFQRRLWAEKTEEALAVARQKGVTIHHPDRAPFAAATASLLRAYEGNPVGDYVRRIQETP
jgi:tripartite ATP-independent transporter DctP family solute receptor